MVRFTANGNIAAREVVPPRLLSTPPSEITHASTPLPGLYATFRAEPSSKSLLASILDPGPPAGT